MLLSAIVLEGNTFEAGVVANTDANVLCIANGIEFLTYHEDKRTNVTLHKDGYSMFMSQRNFKTSTIPLHAARIVM